MKMKEFSFIFNFVSLFNSGSIHSHLKTNFYHSLGNAYKIGCAPTILMTPKAMRLWRPHSSIATATIKPVKNSIVVS